MPPPNDLRRAQLADAAIELLAEAGVHGVTHRSVERRAGLPAGTASNYFRSREALLIAAADRILALHQTDMDGAARREREAGPAAQREQGARPAADGTPPREGRAGPAADGAAAERAARLIAGSLLASATTYRARYLAIFELRLESLRRPALASALAEVFRRSVAFTTAHHADLALPIPPEAVPVLVTLYGGALFTLVTGEPADVTEEAVRDIADAVVRGALGGPGPHRPAGRLGRRAGHS